MSTSTAVIPDITHTVTQIGGESPRTSTYAYTERSQLYAIESGKHVTMPATTDPARFFYRAEGWDYGEDSPATATSVMLEYLAGLQTVSEQLAGQSLGSCSIMTCEVTGVIHSMISATVLVEATEVGPAVYSIAPTRDGITALPVNTPETTSPATPAPAPPVVTPQVTPPAEQQQPSQAPYSPEAPDSPKVPVPTLSSQTVTSPAPIAATPPGEVTLIREGTSNGQILTETIISVSAAPTAERSEETVVTTATMDGTPVVQTIISISPAEDQGRNDSEGVVTGAAGAPAQETVTRTIVSDGQTYVQTLISPAQTGSSPGETTFVRTATSDGTTLVQTVVSQRPGSSAGGNGDGEGSTASATSGSAGSESSGPAAESEGYATSPCSGQRLAAMAAVLAAGLILEL